MTITNQPPVAVTHPAKFSPKVLDAIRNLVINERAASEWSLTVLDPFGGAGGIHDLTDIASTISVEIEPEWSQARSPNRGSLSITGDALNLEPLFEPGSIDVIATSPCYGNRMADTYDGRGTCQACGGRGFVCECGDPTEHRHVAGGPLGLIVCVRCGGLGRDRSSRSTYRLALGRMPTEGSSAVLQWGADYRAFHEVAIGQMVRTVRPGGLVVVNMSNHVRGGEVMPVVEWWIGAMAEAGLLLVEVQRIATRRYRFGANAAARVDGEHLIVMRRP